MFEWLKKHSGHTLIIQVFYDVMKTFHCSCVTCGENDKFDYLK